jgi:TolB-like protein
MLKKAIFVFILLSALLTFPRAGFCQGSSVAVFPMKNNGQPQMNGLSSGISSMLATNLLKSKSVAVIDPQRVSAALKAVRLTGGSIPTGDALKIAGDLGADYALVGEFVVFGNKFRIDTRLYDVKDGTLRSAEKAQAKEDDLFEVVDDLSNRVILAIAGTLPTPPGGIMVETEPAGASVTIDGTRAGASPVTVPNVGPGTHRVDISLEGYQDHTEPVSVKEGETAKVSVKLVRLFGGVRIWWQGIPSSDISFAGETVPVTQFRNMEILTKYCKNVPAGTYHLAVRMPSKDESAWDNNMTWKTYKAEIVINPGEVADIFLNNDYRAPDIQVSTCGGCAANWDFTVKMAWYETR